MALMAPALMAPLITGTQLDFPHFDRAEGGATIRDDGVARPAA
jgi:hypothetical protein